MKRVAVITGTTSGIGEAIAKYYIYHDYSVFAINRNDCDLKDPNNISLMVEILKKTYQRIDVLVNNAGMMFLDDFKIEMYDTVSVNMLSPILLCQELLLNNILTHGQIINIASVAGITGDIDAPIYSSCKAAIINLTRSLAKSYAPNIRVNCISPGFFNTNLVPEDTPQELIDQVPLKREAEPNEIIPVIDMLHRCTYITGANIVIDGGLSL